MRQEKDYLRLRGDLTPLMRKLAGHVDHNRLRLNFDDMIGFFEEKLIMVWTKYQGQLEFEDIKAIGIASLYNLRTKVSKKYSREISLDEDLVEDYADEPYQDYLELAKPHLTEAQFWLLELLVDPPEYLRSRSTEGKRIPSEAVLEYMAFPTDRQAVKKLNTIRRGIFSSVKSAVS